MSLTPSSKVQPISSLRREMDRGIEDPLCPLDRMSRNIFQALFLLYFLTFFNDQKDSDNKTELSRLRNYIFDSRLTIIPICINLLYVRKVLSIFM